MCQNKCPGLWLWVQSTPLTDGGMKSDYGKGKTLRNWPGVAEKIG